MDDQQNESNQNLPKKIIDGLWNESISPDEYGPEMFKEHIFEQYKICVEMADRVSARRSLANTFFLTLHTLLVSIAGFVFEKGPQVSTAWFNLFPLFAVLALCYVWYRLILSYQQLNGAKYEVIGEFELKLPTSPYYSAEWNALGQGIDPTKYQPLTKVELYIPKIFAGLYIGAFVALVLQAYNFLGLFGS